MQSSSACHSALLVLVLTATTAARADEGPPASAAADGRERSGPGSVIVLPTRTPIRSPVDGGAVDLLLAMAFQDLGFEVMDRDTVLDAFHADARGLDEARGAYLDMRLEDALRLARIERESHLAHRGDLLRDQDLQEAELFMVQVLMDLGRGDEAAAVAAGLLEANPSLRLDPAEYAPQVQALWASVVESRAGVAARLSPADELRELAALVGADWLALAAWSSDDSSEPGLRLRLVPVRPDEEVTEHFGTLGTPATWGNTLRGMLLERFFPPEPETDVAFGPGSRHEPGIPADGVEADPSPWYRRWWFWAAVGVVVAGAAAGAVGGYYANKDSGDPEVTADFQW